MSATVNLQPTLTGQQVVVRPILPSDFAKLFAVASDPLIWQQHPSSDRYIESVFKDYFDNAIDSRSAFVFIDRASQAIIGSSRYHGHDETKSEIEIGWTFLGRQYWGGTYNREIKKLMVEHAFLFVTTVVFWIGSENLRSRKAVEKIGGVLRDGIHKRHPDDAEHVIYELRRL